jgi:hypothetical protein
MYDQELQAEARGISDSDREKLRQFEILAAEANTVRDKDKILVRGLFRNFYNKRLNVGIGFQRAYGSILPGDYFDLIKLPDGNYLFIFADISGHGLPAYTTLIRLRSAITMAIRETTKIFKKMDTINSDFLVSDISTKFTDIMDESNSHDFACVNFTFIYNEDDKFHLKFYNRSMLFPIVVRKFKNSIVDIYNLNNKDKGWVPLKGHLLGSDVRKLLDSGYLVTPSCSFTLYEGDSILFYSDGIVEACGNEGSQQEFGEQRLIDILSEYCPLTPQVVINLLFESVYGFIGDPKFQKDDMTAILIDFPPVRD